jgi:hypothetical protein
MQFLVFVGTKKCISDKKDMLTNTVTAVEVGVKRDVYTQRREEVLHRSKDTIRGIKGHNS